MIVPFQKWNWSGIIQFQSNMQLNSHSFYTISYQVIISSQFKSKMEHSRNKCMRACVVSRNAPLNYIGTLYKFNLTLYKINENKRIVSETGQADYNIHHYCNHQN